MPPVEFLMRRTTKMGKSAGDSGIDLLVHAPPFGIIGRACDSPGWCVQTCHIEKQMILWQAPKWADGTDILPACPMPAIPCFFCLFNIRITHSSTDKAPWCLAQRNAKRLKCTIFLSCSNNCQGRRGSRYVVAPVPMT